MVLDWLLEFDGPQVAPRIHVKGLTADGRAAALHLQDRAFFYSKFQLDLVDKSS